MQPNILKLVIIHSLILLCVCGVQYLLAEEEETHAPSPSNTQLTNQNELHAKSRLIISTLDGSLIGVDPLTGNIAWTLQDGEIQTESPLPVYPLNFSSAPSTFVLVREHCFCRQSPIMT
ncbi:hypothetical protein M8J77_005613 [Diaphorina citri]|nr:hypothetical protein M8J77_005613 [Diaphorina citri]